MAPGIARSGRRPFGFGCAAALLLGCGAGQAERPPAARAAATASTARAPSDCAAGRLARARASELLRANRRLAALEAIDDANRLCPRERAASLADEETLRSLLEPRGPATLDAAVELLDEARRRRASGELTEVSLLEERAVRLLERAAGRELAVALPRGGDGKTGGAFVGHGDWLLLHDRDGVSLRRSGEWYPEFFGTKLPERAYAEESVLAPSGRWLLVPVAGLGVEAGQKGPGFLASLKLELGERFGSEGPRLGADLRAPWRLSPDGSKLFFAEPGATQPLAVADVETLAVRHRLPAPSEAASLEGAPLAAGDQFALAQWRDGAIGLLDLATGDWLHFRSRWGSLSAAALSPDERFAVWRGDSSGEGEKVVILDTASCRSTCVLREFFDSECTLWSEPVFAPDSRSLAIGSEGSKLCLVDLASGQLAARLDLARHGDRVSLTRPYRFTKGGGGLLVSLGPGDFRLVDLKRRRELPLPLGAVGALRSVRGMTALVGGEGITLIDQNLKLRSLKLDRHPQGWPMSWTSFENELRIMLERGFIVMDATTGATKDLPFPPFTRNIDSETRPLSANVDGPLAEIYARGSWQRVPGSPRFFANLGAIEVVNGELVFGDASVERRWSVREGLRSTPRAPEPAEAERTSSGGWSEPLQAAGEARLFKRSEEHKQLVIWDLAGERSLGELPLDPLDAKPLALSPGDRFVLIGQEIWDLPRRRRVVRLAEPVESAVFAGDGLLATTAGPRLTLYTGPGFSPALALFAAREGDAAVAFAFDATGAVRALETFGPEAAWDTTFACGVEPFGVPFRVCRGVFGAKGLLEAVLGR